MVSTVFVILIVWIAVGVGVAMLLGRASDLGSRADIRQQPRAGADLAAEPAAFDPLEDYRSSR